MDIYDIPLKTIDGEDTSLRAFEGKGLLIVNVASHCGFTPQYAGLQALHDTYGPKGLTVLGFPCNQFKAQEPGNEDQIKTFCESSFGVTFPLFAKIEVNGENRHPLYAELTAVPTEEDGQPADVRWNFEKFVVAPDGSARRFSTLVTPEDPKLIEAIEAALPRDRTVKLDVDEPARTES